MCSLVSAEPRADRVRRVGELAARAHAQRLLLHALASALQDLRRAAVDEGGEASFEDAVDAGSAHGVLAVPRYQRMRPVSTSTSIVKSPRRL